MNIKNFEKKKIAVISGSGNLPIFVVNELIKNNCNFIVLCFDKDNEHYFKKKLNISKNKLFHIEMSKISDILFILKREKIKQAVCCGGVKFTCLQNLNLSSLKTFFLNYKIIFYVLKAFFSKQKGDNFLLSIAEKILNSIKCNVISVQTILPNLICSKKDEINHQLVNKYKKDINYGSKILDELSSYDIGQSIAIHDCRVLGIECAEGTQNLIKRCNKYLDKKKYNKKPVLIKKAKLIKTKNLIYQQLESKHLMIL